MFGVLLWSFIFVVCNAAFHKRLPVGKIVPRPNYCAIKNHYGLHLLSVGNRYDSREAGFCIDLLWSKNEASKNKLEIVSSGKKAL